MELKKKNVFFINMKLDLDQHSSNHPQKPKLIEDMT